MKKDEMKNRFQASFAKEVQKKEHQIKLKYPHENQSSNWIMSMFEALKCRPELQLTPDIPNC